MSSKKSAPISVKVAHAMNKIGVVGLPRNYELFYAAMCGTITELQQELWNIGGKIDQAALDELHRKYCARADDEEVVSKICDSVQGHLNEAISMIRKEQVSVSNYGKVLNQASSKLDPRAGIPKEVVNTLVHLLSDATNTAKTQGMQTLENIEDSTTKLASMKKQLEEYKKLAETDSLTGLLNRRAFDQLSSSIKPDQFTSCALIIGDIDSFKSLNDTYGHPFGDIVIKVVAKTITSNTREDFIMARVGGEEFAILSYNISAEGMALLAERLRVAVAETSFTDGKTKLPTGKVTISFGVCHGTQARDHKSLYEQADEALYKSKRNGRNSVTSYADDVQSPDRKNLLLYGS